MSNVPLYGVYLPKYTLLFTLSFVNNKVSIFTYTVAILRLPIKLKYILFCLHNLSCFFTYSTYSFLLTEVRTRWIKRRESVSAIEIKNTEEANSQITDS